MRDYDLLTPLGKTRRLRALAAEALACYDIKPRRMTLLKYSWNTVLRVDAVDGKRYALRISRPGVRDLLAIRSELTWMEALARETPVIVPRPLETRDGALVVEVTALAVTGPRNISLFPWIGGRHVRQAPSSRLIALLGETMALLHEHAQSFVPPVPFTTDRFDRLGTFTGMLEPAFGQFHPLVGAERLNLFRREAARVQIELDRLFGGPSPPRFLHLDLHLGNVKLLGNQLAVFDFDDSMWAYPVQDIAISFYYLGYARGFGPEVWDSFKAGYCRVGNWPEEWPGQIRLLVEARALDLVDVLLSLEHPSIRDYLSERLQAIEDHVRELAGK